MGERITAIREVINERDGEGRYGGEDGYDVVTTERTIKLRIDSSQQCCEDWGSMSTPDDPASFVGASLLSVSTVDGDNEDADDDGTYDNTLFVNVETSIGQLQLAVYNHHNGYYGHSVSVTSDPPLEGASYTGGLWRRREHAAQSPLTHGIGGVVGMCAKKEMRGIAASPVIARVTHQ